MDKDWSQSSLSEHHASLRGFTAISDMHEKGQFVDIVAVVADFTEIKSTRGTDMHRSLIVCDHTAALSTTGLMVQFYRESAEDLPRPAKGSIVILKSFKLFDHRSVFQAWSSRDSNWIVLDANGTNVLSKSSKLMSGPTPDIMVYARRLAQWWKTRMGVSSSKEVAIPINLNSATSRSTGRSTLLVSQMREGVFFDTRGYVVKTYPSSDSLFTVYLTDYTTNTQLHDYVYGESKWTGPYGQRTVQITLWDAHARYARSHVREDMYLSLRNVQGKRGDSGRLEGAMRGDRDNPSKVNVIVINQNDPAVKTIKLRKSQYETAWSHEKERIDEEVIAQHHASKVLQLTPPTSVNPNLETSYQQVPTTAVGDILEPPFLPQAERKEGPAGRRRPHKFRTVGRIIDFWPPDLRDFSTPYCMACQSTYSPRVMDLQARASQQVCTLCETPRDDDDPDTYEFAFTVLLEGQDCVCLPVIFSGDDIETLLGEDLHPCNLYLPENASMLIRLRERLFLLWGDLEERLNSRSNKRIKTGRKGSVVEEEEQPLMWNEFCILEYWVNEFGGFAGWKGRRFRGFGMRIT